MRGGGERGRRERGERGELAPGSINGKHLAERQDHKGPGKLLSTPCDCRERRLANTLTFS